MRVHKKPDVYEAIQWSGSNWHEVYAEFGHEVYTATEGDSVLLRVRATPTSVEYTAGKGDWIVRDRNGVILPPMSDEIFMANYDPIPFV